MEEVNPAKESGPISLKISRRNPVAAEEENRRTKIRGMRRAGKENACSKGVKSDSKKERIPQARRAETALMRPISAGAVFNTVRKPLSVPDVNKSKTGSFFKIPESRITDITNGMIKSEKKRRIFMEPD